MLARSAGLFLTLWLAAPAAGQPARIAAATLTSPAASVCNRPPGGNVFLPVAENASLYTTDTLVCLAGATFTSKHGAVAVRSRADFDGRSPLPILETAVVLNNPEPDVDLDLTLDRGRLELINARNEGSARAKVRFWGQTWTVVLEGPRSRVSFELCGRWPAGTRFKRLGPRDDPAKAPSPVASLVFLVLEGTAALDVGGTTLALKAPPGPAQLRWDSVGGTRPQPLKLDRLPEWADPGAEVSPAGRQVAAAVEKFRAALAADPARAIDSFLNSEDPTEVRIALVALGAFDDLDRLVRVLSAARSPAVWDFGVAVWRHWLGRGPGQDQRLYDYLTSRGGYSDGQARVIVQLLFGFSAEDTALPETYEVLIDYLTHEKPLIRNLAAWHLVRLVPVGRSIPFKPDGTDEDAARTQAAWRKLVPPGQLPPGVPKE